MALYQQAGGGPRFIFIGIANSEDAKEDLENILLWFSNSFGLK